MFLSGGWQRYIEQRNRKVPRNKSTHVDLQNKKKKKKKRESQEYMRKKNIVLSINVRKTGQPHAKE